MLHLAEKLRIYHDNTDVVCAIDRLKINPSNTLYENVKFRLVDAFQLVLRS